MSRRRRILSITWKSLAILVVLFIYFAWPGRWTFTVSPETTYVTGPLDKDGYVDYVTALNERLSKGIKPDDNANVLIWQALGPRPEGGDSMPAEYFKWLGTDPPAEQGDYLIGWENYLKGHLKEKFVERHEASGDRLMNATKRPWKSKDEPELADWLKRNEKPLALTSAAARRPHYYNPLVPERTPNWSAGLLDSRLPNVQKCRELAFALIRRSMLRISEGKIDEAWQDLLTCHRLGRLLSHGGTLIELLVGLAVNRIASDADLVLIDHSNLTSKQLMLFFQDLRSLPPMSSVADKMDLGDRFTLLDLMMLTARDGAQHLGGKTYPYATPPQDKNLGFRLFTRNINWDPGLRNANRWVDRCVAASRMTNRAERAQEMAKISQDVRDLKRELEHTWLLERFFLGPTQRGEMIGNIMIGLMLPAFDKIQSGWDRDEQSHHNLHIAFGLAAFRADTGHYPAKLEELTPEYLDKIPNDLFSVKPLIYKPDGKGYLLYSVGPNGVDDEGQTYDDDPRGDDITVRMPAPPPREKK